jgi:hypothetical protein
VGINHLLTPFGVGLAGFGGFCVGGRHLAMFQSIAKNRSGTSNAQLSSRKYGVIFSGRGRDGAQMHRFTVNIRSAIIFNGIFES